MGIFFRNLVHFKIANLAKSEPAFQISPAKCAGKLRYPKEGFCNYMKKGKVKGRHESVDGLLLILLGVGNMTRKAELEGNNQINIAWAIEASHEMGNAGPGNKE